MTHDRPFGLAVVGGAVAVLGALAACSGNSDLFGGTPPANVGGAGATGTTTSVSTGGHGTTTTTSGGGSGTGTTTSGGNGGSGGEGGAGGPNPCTPPFAECDGNLATLCETNTDTSNAHCGGCGQPCASSCEQGHCGGPCDDAIAIDEADPVTALRAIGLCEGVTAASWVQADGTAPPGATFHVGHGVLPNFGPNVHPQEGSRLLALSSGTARRPGDGGYQSPEGFDKGYQCAQPTGAPLASPSCAAGEAPGAPFDSVGIQATLQVPPNAGGLSFKHRFFTWEWPDWVCSQFADVFTAFTVPVGSGSGTILDDLGNPMGAANAFIDACGCDGGPPCAAGGLSYDCPLGAADLTGTGFESHAASGWLETRIPVGGPTVTLRWTTFDSADGIMDSTALVDDFRWILSPGPEPVTEPVVDPID